MTLLEIVGARVGEERIPALPPFSARLDVDRPAVAVAEGDRGPMLASLIAAGRLVPDGGEVLLDGGTDPAALRRAVALVDTPVVAEPAPSLPVRSVVREELRFAGRPSRSRDAEALLTALDLDRWSRAPILDLPPTDRIRLLLELAALRNGVRALVLTSPERHGGHAAGWRRLAEDLTARGLPVLVIGGAAVRESTPSAPETPLIRDLA
jgi:ABC-2 type transport system ATP-binding protein